MTPEQFVYWLQGYSEVSGEQPTKEQWIVIQDHLKTVFHKETPDRTVYKTIDPTITHTGTGRNPWEPPYTITC